MTDPVSIAAALLAFAEVTLKGIRLIETIRNIRQDIRTLRDQLENSRIVLHLLIICLEARTRASNGGSIRVADCEVEGIIYLLQATMSCYKAIKEELADMITSKVTATQEIFVHKRRWLYRKSHLEKKRAELQQHMQALMTTIQAMHFADMYSSQSGISLFDSAPFPREHGFGSSRRIIAGRENEEHDSIPQKVVEYPRGSSEHQNTVPETDHDNFGSNAAISPQLSDRRDYRCNTKCGCVCHQQQSLQVQLQNRFLGIFAAESKGIWTSTCTEDSCNRKSTTRRLSTALCAPSWFWQRWIYATFSSNPLIGVNLALKISRVVDIYSPAMEYASYGNVEGLKSLFSDGLASPMDWCPLPAPYCSGGRTMISQAIGMMSFQTETQQIEVVRFLIDAGADIQHELCQREALAALQACKIGTEEGLFLLRKIVNSGDILDDNRLSDIHCILLGLGDTESSLQQELEVPGSVDVQSTYIRPWSALDYAVLKGDLGLLKTLLTHGAQPRLNAQRHPYLSRFAGTPALKNHYHIIKELLSRGARVDSIFLIAVMCSASAKTVRLLMDHVVNVDEQDEYGKTALHAAMKWHNEPATRILLSSNIDISLGDLQQHNALHEAASRDFTTGARLLLQCGAKLESVSRTGETPLHCAAAESSLATLRFLIEQGANKDARKTDTRETPLHCASRSIDMPYAYRNPKFDVIHGLLHAGTDANSLCKSGELPIDCITLRSTAEHFAGCIAAFLSHNVSFSCRQILMVIENKNLTALRLLLARRDLFDMDRFPDDQERIFECAAKYPDSSILECLRSESWKGCYVWFGTRTKRTQYQDPSFILYTSCGELNEDCQIAFAALQNKLGRVVFQADTIEKDISLALEQVEPDPETCRSKFRDILTEVDRQAISQYEVSPTGLRTLRFEKGYSVIDPVLLEGQAKYDKSAYSNVAAVTPPLTCWESISDSGNFGECWLKCSCGLFIYQSDPGLWIKQGRGD